MRLPIWHKIPLTHSYTAYFLVALEMKVLVAIGISMGEGRIVSLESCLFVIEDAMRGSERRQAQIGVLWTPLQ